jgi:hypothetical protein
LLLKVFSEEIQRRSFKIFIKILEGNGTENKIQLFLPMLQLLAKHGKYGNYDDCLALQKKV